MLIGGKYLLLVMVLIGKVLKIILLLIKLEKFAFRVKDYISLNSTQVQIKSLLLLIVLMDHLSGGSLVEAAIDDLMLYEAQSGNTSINDALATKARLIKVTDILGKEINIKSVAKYTTLFYIYDDGSVEKRIYLEQ